MNEKGLSVWTIVGHCLECKAPLYRWELVGNPQTKHIPRWTCACVLSNKRKGATGVSEPNRGSDRDYA